MRKGMLIGLLAAIGSAGLGLPAQAGVPERWQGFLLRDGLRVPIAVELAATGAEWTGRFRAGNVSSPLEHVRMTGVGVHFEIPGEGAFDGTVAGDLMAGSLSGSGAPGSFALAREVEEPFAVYPSGP